MSSTSENTSARSADGTPREIVLAPAGETRQVRLAACSHNHLWMPPLTVEHGSSLSLISKATTMLNAEFRDMDPEADWAKWEARGGTIYFFAVLNEENPAGPPACVLRLVLDGDFDAGTGGGPSNSDDAPDGACPRRVIMEYLTTSEAARGRGYAGRLIDCVRELARGSTANLLVLAVEESCPFWMTHGFVLEDGPIKKRVNSFSDSHVLKLPTNRPDAFPASFESDDDSSSSGDEEESSSSSSDEDEDEQLQQVLLASMLPTAALGSESRYKDGASNLLAATAADNSASINTAHHLDKDLTMQSRHANCNEQKSGLEDEDDQLQRALLASMLSAPAADPESRDVGGANGAAAAAAAGGSPPIDLTDSLDEDLNENREEDAND